MSKLHAQPHKEPSPSTPRTHPDAGAEPVPQPPIEGALLLIPLAMAAESPLEFAVVAGSVMITPVWPLSLGLMLAPVAGGLLIGTSTVTSMLGECIPTRSTKEPA